MEGSPALNNYYYHSGSFLAADPDYKRNSASVYYIGMNK
jgi:hypothetical protein